MVLKVTRGRGNNLHEVEAHNGSKFLVSMPTKFRKSVWIKRGNFTSPTFIQLLLCHHDNVFLPSGDFVVVEPIAEGNKVQAEIVRILYAMQIKSLRQQGMW